ncbi:MAG: TylF/MycF/NovP-related O-methyltransferase [Burkholderiales bacterium]
MAKRKLAHRFIELSGYAALRVNRGAYHQDGLYSIHNHDFMRDPAFARAYQRGVVAAGDDYGWHWRVHVGLWAARAASHLAGDFVECGVNKGFLSSAIMELLDWDTHGRTFYLMDTFSGLDERYVSAAERARGVLGRNKGDFYTRSVEAVEANFSEWKNVRIVVGTIPETLPQVESQRIAFLHIDMNCAPPEVAALDYFWDRLSPGAFVVLDDYAYKNFELQKAAMDELAERRNVAILSLPTGQGLLIKPA